MIDVENTTCPCNQLLLEIIDLIGFITNFWIYLITKWLIIIYNNILTRMFIELEVMKISLYHVYPLGYCRDIVKFNMK